MSELKKQIEQALKGFLKDAPRAAAGKLLNVLGYESDKTADIEPNTWAGFKEFFPVEEKAFNTDAARVDDWRSIDIVFQLTDEELKKRNDLFSTGKVDNRVIESYLFLAVSLSGTSFSRTDLVRITREVNKLTPMPAMLFFRYGDSLTIAAIDRRLHKRDENRDVLEKVTLIKDISTVRPHRAHIEILHDLALENMSGAASFVALHNAWRKALDSSELNKRFYREIADWYFWAVKEVQFPLPQTNKLAADPTNNSIAMIRLLTRLIFVWFLKEKGLVPDKLFDEKELAKILVGANGVRPDETAESKAGARHAPLQGNHSTYYRAILQNLFFATLNAEMNRDRAGSRRFVEVEDGSIHGQKTEYGVKNLYRYSKLFTIPKEEAVKLFDDIPFLNGGLFECLDKEDDSGKVVYVDGFTRNQKLQPVVPDYLFFSDRRTMDLSADYGDKKRAQEKVRGIISILRDYKFTVAENTPVEEEVALDPELLGNVFENLLASYNPETGATARKLTGSFYTPRMIVNYMVDESLKAYLAQKIGAYRNTPLQEKLDTLIAWNDHPNPFSQEETAILIEAINNLKTLDPAVGSGAFPMGLLHKIVHILHKLDPDNARWKQAQLEAAHRLPDPAIRHDLISHIEDAFDPASNRADYGRKLYLIQNCIYGVDIQPIAVQIAKLRFFISLVVDQKVNDKKKNRGVLALPNLETRFVAANTLLGIDKPVIDDLFAFQVRAKEAELRTVRARHFDARTRAEKLKCMADDKRIRKEIAELLEQEHYPHDKAVRLSNWNPYDQNTSADFFDAEWMFGIEDGFDITIGNPPYVRADAGGEHLALRQRILESKQYETLWEKWDLFVPFIEKGFKLLKSGGITTMIVSDAYCHSKYAQKSQSWFLKNSRVLRLDFCADLKIFDAAVHNVIYFFQRDEGAHHTPARRVHRETFGNVTTLPSDVQEKLTYRAFLPDIGGSSYSNPTLPLTTICYISYGLAASSDEKLYKGEFVTEDVVQDFQDATHPKRYIEGKDIRQWFTPSHRFLEWGTKRAPHKFRRQTFLELHETAEKLMTIVVTAGLPPVMFDDLTRFTTHTSCIFVPWHALAGVRNNSLKKTARYRSETPPRPDLPKREELEATSRRVAVKYLLGVMNASTARDFLRANRRSNIHLYPDDWKKLPIPDVPPVKQQPIVALVDKILAAKRADKSVNVSALEAEINRLVAELYGLVEGRT